MFALAIVLTVLTGLAFLVWSSRHLMINTQRRQGVVLSETYPVTLAQRPMISVVVAAKDEEANIETCVRSMLGQDYPHFEVIVANDRSVDRTAEIVQRIADEDPRVRLVNIQQLPEGWCGKNNAMQTAVATARGEWICMIDADCRQTSARTLSAAMQYAHDKQADMISVLPTLEMKGFWENVLQPVCGGIMIIWFHPDKVNNPRRPHAYANGAFMMMRRTTYETIGTHAAVKDQVNEDMHMALRAKQAGLNLQVVQNQGLYVVRMYTSLPQIIRGWSRIFYGCFGTLRRLLLSIVVMLVMGLLPYITAATCLSLWAATVQPTIVLVAGLTGLAAALMQISAIFRFYRLIGARAELCWTYPMGCAFGLYMLCLSISKLRSGAKLTWRGTHYTRKTGA